MRKRERERERERKCHGQDLSSSSSCLCILHFLPVVGGGGIDPGDFSFHFFLRYENEKIRFIEKIAPNYCRFLSAITRIGFTGKSAKNYL